MHKMRKKTKVQIKLSVSDMRKKTKVQIKLSVSDMPMIT
jgi:hypothetical protein